MLTTSRGSTTPHHVGDKVLITVANLLSTGLAAVAKAAFVARIGGEEFLIVLPGTTLTDTARRLDHIRATVGLHPLAAVDR